MGEGEGEGEGVVEGELPCMSCAQAWRDAVRGDAVSPDGVAGQGLGAKRGRRKKRRRKGWLWKRKGSDGSAG